MLMWMDRFFKIKSHGSSFRIESMAGLTTFVTMAYILLVNPNIMGAAGMNKGAVFVATALVCAIACLLVSVLSNYPIAIAPGMALNAYFAYVVVGGLGLSWQAALGCVFIAGVLFFVLAICPLKKLIVHAIPETMHAAIPAGLGFFIAMLGLKNGGVIVPNPNTLLTLGHLGSYQVILCLLGFCIMVSLDVLKIPGAILIGIAVSSLIGFLLGHGHFHGVVSWPSSITPTLGQMSLQELWHVSGIQVVFAFFLVSLFDSTGTLIGLLNMAGLSKEKGYAVKMPRALVSSSVASIAGAYLGTSSCTPYCESAAGIGYGGKTGLTSLVIAFLFILSLFFSPLAQSVPGYAAASALIYVGCLMLKSLKDIHWEDMTETIPSLVTVIMIPLSFSISDGVGLGFIAYALVKLLSGKVKSIHPFLAVWALIFAIYFVWRM